eukprot:1145104-Pelagomonas_calceolata.AAC.2
MEIRWPKRRVHPRLIWQGAPNPEQSNLSPLKKEGLHFKSCCKCSEAPNVMSVLKAPLFQWELSTSGKWLKFCSNLLLTTRILLIKCSEHLSDPTTLKPLSTSDRLVYEKGKDSGHA